MAGHTQNVEWRSRQNEGTLTDSYSQAAGSTATAVITHPILRITATEACVLTLPNGNPGQMIKIITMGDFDTDVTPTTSTEVTAIALDDTGDSCTLLYANDTDGWLIIGTNGAANAILFTVAS